MMQAGKPRSSKLMAAGSLIFVVIFILEFIMHWQLSGRKASYLLECSTALQKSQLELSAIRNASRNVNDEHNIGQEAPNKESKAFKDQYELSIVEIFRRFVLQPPAPADIPYNLEDLEATYYSRSEHDRIVDSLLKQREKGFFLEVFPDPTQRAVI
jgi:hypothetical protein